MNHQDLLRFLKATDIFKGLSEPDLQLLIPFLRLKHFERGDWILKEGETGEELFFIKEGEAEVLKGENHKQQPLRLAVLKPGDWIGEMSFLEKEKRSASVRAVDKTEVLVLMLKELQESSLKETVYSRVIHHLAARISRRLRVTDDHLISTLKEKIQLTRLQDEVGKTIVYVFIFMALYLNLVRLSSAYLTANWNQLNEYFYPITIIVLGIFSLLLINSSHSPLEFYGLTWKNWKKNILEAALWTIPLGLILTVFKWAMITFVPELKGEDLFSFRASGESMETYVYSLIIYLVLVPIQELTARGFLQTSFRNFFQGPHRVFNAILSSNVLYNIFHNAADVWFSLITFCFGIYWGYLYEKQKSIVGPTVSHALVGVMAFFILNYDALISFAEKHSFSH